MSKARYEKEMILKMREIILLYKRINPTGTYLNLSFLQTAGDKGRIHINNAHYDRDRMNSVDITEDIPL